MAKIMQTVACVCPAMGYVRRRRWGLRGLGVLAVCVPLLAAAAPATAGAGAGLLVVPQPVGGSSLSYFTLDGRPGRVVSAGALGLVNRGSRTLRVALAAVPGRTIDTLGSTYAPPGTPPGAAAAWLRLGPRRLTLPAHARLEIPVTVAVPRGAGAGDRLAGVDVEALGQGAESANRGVSIASAVRYVIGVEVSVPGPRHPLIQFTGARVERQPSALVFLLDAVNRGNAILPGVHGAALITAGTRIVAHVPLGPGTFVTGSAIAYPVPAPAEHPAEGTVYRIRAYLRYGHRVATLDTLVRFGHGAAARQRAYSPAPAGARRGSGLPAWLWALVGAGLLYAAVTTLLLVRSRRRRQTPPPAVPARSGSPAVPPLPPVGARDEDDATGHADGDEVPDEQRLGASTHRP